MGHIMDIASWLIVASLVVLIITHPNGFSKDVTSLGSVVTGGMHELTGANTAGGG